LGVIFVEWKRLALKTRRIIFFQSTEVNASRQSVFPERSQLEETLNKRQPLETPKQAASLSGLPRAFGPRNDEGFGHRGKGLGYRTALNTRHCEARSAVAIHTVHGLPRFARNDEQLNQRFFKPIQPDVAWRFSVSAPMWR
jgi:hypothetical protein